MRYDVLRRKKFFQRTSLKLFRTIAPTKIFWKIIQIPSDLITMVFVEQHLATLGLHISLDKKIPNCWLVGHSWWQMMCLYQ